MKNYILLLATLSGTCGIAYEVLYSRMLSTYMGDMFYVAASILTAFLLSLGVGALYAQRWPRSLGWIEIAIGLFALIASYVFKLHGESFVTAIVTLPVNTPMALTLSVFLIIIPPALMIGFSVPLFTHYRNNSNPEESNVKSLGWVYCSYNLGAAFCVLIIEYLLLRNYGISLTTQFIAVINILIGIAILRIPAVPSAQQASAFQYNCRELSLFLASFASGVFQLFILKMIGKIFGPYNENFSIVLFLALLGIFLGSALVTFTKIRFQALVLLAGISTAVVFLTLGETIYLWATLNESYMGPLSLSWLLKLLVITVMVIIPFTLIGGLIPAFLKNNLTNLTSGQTLALSSFGNCTGYLITLLFIHQALTEEYMALFIVLILLLSSILFAWKKLSSMALVVALLSVILIPNYWPTELLQIGFRNLSNPGRIDSTLSLIESAKTYRGINSTIDLVSTKDDKLFYIINGYKSLAIGGDKKSNLRELIVGMSPALFNEKHENALVLGLGTGITSAGAAGVYDEVDVVEINPLVIDMIDVFKEQNLSVSKKPHVHIKLQDGLIALMQTNKKYDAIINTVTSPAYFSSAKLYTVNFFKLASNHLKPNGVYSIWFDAWLTNNGVGIILSSLKQAFEYCRPLHLSKGYHQIICSHSPLELNQNIKITKELRRYFSDELLVTMTPENLMSNLVIQAHPRFSDNEKMGSQWNKLFNTFDKPSLEFDMSANVFNLEYAQLQPIKYENLHLSPYGGKPLNSNEMAERCAAFTIVSVRRDVDCLLDTLEANNKISVSRYLNLVLHHFEKLKETSNALDLINVLKKAKSAQTNKLVEDLVFLMCERNLNHKQRSFFEFLYVNALIAEGSKIPDKTLRSMTSMQAIPEARTLSAKLIRLFALPQYINHIDKQIIPCA